MVNKDRIMNDSVVDWLRSVPAVRWVFLVLNFVVNTVLTLVAVGVFIPWAVYFALKTKSDNGDSIPWRYLLTELNTNSPWAIILVLPVALLSLIFPLYGKSNFLLLLRAAQSIAAWNQLTLALATCMYLGRLVVKTLHQNGFKDIPLFIYFGLGAACVLAFQAICMALLALCSWIGHARIIGKDFEREGQKFKNRDYKLLAAFYLAFDAILVIVFMVYVGAQMYEYFTRPSDFHPSFERTFFEVPLVIIFGLGGSVNVIISIAGTVMIVYALIQRNYERNMVLSIVAFNSVAFLVYLLVFVIVAGILLVITFIAKSPPDFPFFHSLFAIGALAIFKIVPFLESLCLSISNSKVNVIKGGRLSNNLLHEFRDI